MVWEFIKINQHSQIIIIEPSNYPQKSLRHLNDINGSGFFQYYIFNVYIPCYTYRNLSPKNPLLFRLVQNLVSHKTCRRLVKF